MGRLQDAADALILDGWSRRAFEDFVNACRDDELLREEDECLAWRAEQDARVSAEEWDALLDEQYARYRWERDGGNEAD